MSLTLYQEAFMEALFCREPDGSEVAAIPYIKGAALTAHQFEIYREKMITNLSTALAALYPTVAQAIGHPAFLAAAKDYFIQHPPASTNPAEYGDAFASFLTELEVIKEFPYLCDLATLDLGYYHAYHCLDVSVVNTGIFTELSPEQLAARRVKLHPGCFWFSSPYAVYDLWQSHHANVPPRKVNPFAHQDVLIIRPQLQVEIHRIDEAFIATLDELDAGSTLEKALTTGTQVDRDFNAVAAMQFLIQNNLVTTLY